MIVDILLDALKDSVILIPFLFLTYLLLEAVDLGLGAVWLGIAPGRERMEAVRQVLGLPETIQPFCLVACGYPDKPVVPADRYDAARVHYEKW